MNVSLTTELEAQINEYVTSGLYNNVSEFVRESVREHLHKLKVKQLKEILIPRIESAKMGNVVSFNPEKISANARKRYDELKKNNSTTKSGK